MLNEGSYVNAEGRTQHTLDLGVENNLDGRNLKQEAEAIKQAKLEKKNKPKNPNRVAGGKKARATMAYNKLQSTKNLPIFKALGFDPTANNGLKESCYQEILCLVCEFLEEMDKGRN